MTIQNVYIKIFVPCSSGLALPSNLHMRVSPWLVPRCPRIHYNVNVNIILNLIKTITKPVNTVVKIFEKTEKNQLWYI